MSDIIHLKVKSNNQQPISFAMDTERVIRGISPTISFEKVEGGTEIIVTDIEGEQSALILDGRTPAKGEDYFDGEKGDRGEKGEKGDPGYTPIKNVDYFDGEKGDKGDPADPLTVIGTSRQWALSPSADVLPDVWQSDIPTIIQGQYLFCRTRFAFSDNTVAFATSCSYQGVDGDEGYSINLQSPVIAFPADTQGKVILSDVFNCEVYATQGTELKPVTFGTPSAVPSGMEIYTADGDDKNPVGLLTLQVAEGQTYGSASSCGGSIEIPVTSPISTSIIWRWLKLNKGADGKDGKDGKTPVKGVDYVDGQDGYTPVKGVDYDDGISPVVSTQSITNGTRVTISDATGNHIFDVMNGAQGPQGIQGETGPKGNPGTTPTIAVQKIGSVTEVRFSTEYGTKTAYINDGTAGSPGEKGEPGTDGVSPIVSITKSGSVATISITDKDGTKSTTLTDGEKGEDGQPGADGEDGFSPTATVSKSGTTSTITITDKNGTTTAQVLDGVSGEKGDKGDTGNPGADGFSPIATVSKSGSVATITITDKTGTTTATVNDGLNGQDGNDGYTPVKGVDYFDGAKGDKGDKGDPGDDYVLTQADKQEIAQMNIDDTAGTGDTNVTWSANKITSELANAGTIQDVRVNNTSVVTNGIANITMPDTGLSVVNGMLCITYEEVSS